MIPKIAPGSIERPRVQAWFDRNADAPLRLVMAPVGFGKTVAIARYLLSTPRTPFYVRCRPGETAPGLRAKIGMALDAEELPDYTTLLNALAKRSPCDLAIDALDLASPEAIGEINDLVLDSGDGIHIIAGTCARTAVRTPRLFSQGLAVTLDDRTLRFTAGDVAALCETLGARFDGVDAATIVAQTEGWPAVACAIVRWAVSEDRPLRGAIEAWRRTNADFLRDLVDAELQRAPERDRELFVRAVRGEELADLEWARLERRGLFVVQSGVRGKRVHRLVADLFAQNQLATNGGAPVPLTIRLFGRVEAEVAGSTIVWSRRRDFDLVKHLALSPTGSASREELVARFWPNAERQVANARLRTACSNVRRALAARVGTANVGRYFSTNGDVALDLRNVAIDTHAFDERYSAGDHAVRGGDITEALSHFRAAEEIYTGPALNGEADPEFRAAHERYNEAYLALVFTLGRLSREIGAIEDATRYGNLASRLTGVSSLPVRIPENADRYRIAAMRASD